MTVEFDGQENPLDFQRRVYGEAMAYAGREFSKALAFEKMAEYLAKEPPQKPERKEKELDESYNKRVKHWEKELKQFPKAREETIKAFKVLLRAFSNTYPGLHLTMRPDGCYGKLDTKTIPAPWFSFVEKKKGGKTETTIPDLTELLRDRFIVVDED